LRKMCRKAGWLCRKLMYFVLFFSIIN
jgi:hypothetical protein